MHLIARHGGRGGRHARPHYGVPAASPAAVQAYAARSIQLLQAIETTIDFLDSNAEIIRSVATGMEYIVEALREDPPNVELDPEGRISQLLEQGAGKARAMYDDALKRRDAAAGDEHVHEDDGLYEAFDEFICAAADLHNNAEDLREWLETHDALQEQPSGEGFTSVAEYFKTLGIKDAAT